MKIKNLTEEQKVKLVYSLELIIIGLVFIVIAILEFCRVILISNNHGNIFNWITIFGSAWVLFDFFWCTFSKKKRAKVSYLDKCLVLPLALYLIPFDIYCFINFGQVSLDVYQVCIPSALSYICIIYIFEGFYHYKHPIPQLLDEINKEKEEQKKEAELPSNDNDNKEN